MKIVYKGKELDPRLNGHIIHTLEFEDDLIIEKKVEVEKVPLSDGENNLTDKARSVFIGLFREYSTLGLMSKQQCIKYHQKCVG